MNEFPLTEQSPAGRYYVVTRTRSVYEIVLDPDRQPQIIRHRVGENVNLHDGKPLTGVSAFRFDAATGEGLITWWKERPEDREAPDGTYAGSYRRTSFVHLILRDATGRESIAPSAPAAEWSEEVIRRIADDDEGSLLDRIRLGLSGLDEETFAEFVNTAIQVKFESKTGDQVSARLNRRAVVGSGGERDKDNFSDGDRLIQSRAQSHLASRGSNETLRGLTAALGKHVVAAIFGKNVRDIEGYLVSSWKLTEEDELRLRDTFRVFSLIEEADDADVARAWFIGRNRQLNDESPVEQLARGNVQVVLAAARAYVNAG